MIIDVTKRFAQFVQLPPLEGHMTTNAGEELRAKHTRCVVKQTERLKTFRIAPPRDWSARRCLEYLQQVTMLVGECYKADEGAVSAFVDTWAGLHVIYTRKDADDHRRELSRSA
ncbi:MAG: hypothetical protein ACYC1K_00205 [Minisyncoccota bacterium]